MASKYEIFPLFSLVHTEKTGCILLPSNMQTWDYRTDDRLGKEPVPSGVAMSDLCNCTKKHTSKYRETIRCIDPNRL
jgi:hypothetical protein